MNTAILLLGSNIGNKQATIQAALDLLSEKCHFIRMSSTYETAAWGIENQEVFYNLVVETETFLTAEELLQFILNVEKKLGRERMEKWAARVIDIDILFYNSDTINQPELIVPHPFLHKRRFTLVPLAEIRPSMLHPLLNQTISELLLKCEDSLEVKRIL